MCHWTFPPNRGHLNRQSRQPRQLRKHYNNKHNHTNQHTYRKLPTSTKSAIQKQSSTIPIIKQANQQRNETVLIINKEDRKRTINGKKHIRDRKRRETFNNKVYSLRQLPFSNVRNSVLKMCCDSNVHHLQDNSVIKSKLQNAEKQLIQNSKELSENNHQLTKLKDENAILAEKIIKLEQSYNNKEIGHDAMFQMAIEEAKSKINECIELKQQLEIKNVEIELLKYKNQLITTNTQCNQQQQPNHSNNHLGQSFSPRNQQNFYPAQNRNFYRRY